MPNNKGGLMGYFLFGPYFTTFLHYRQPAVYISHAIALCPTKIILDSQRAKAIIASRGSFAACFLLSSKINSRQLSKSGQIV
jgi:hypothetical protein